MLLISLAVQGVHLGTPDVKNYNQLWKDIAHLNTFMFGVSAASDAQIALSQAATTPGIMFGSHCLSNFTRYNVREPYHSNYTRYNITEPLS